MAVRRRIKLGLGLQRVTAPVYPSEPRYVRQMNAQVKALTEELLSIIDQFEDASEDIMLEALEPTYAKARYYTPIDTGELLDSAYLEKASFRGQPRVEMGFARGGFPRYAVYVHEIPGYHHEPPTRAKFLEQALKEDLSGILTRLAAGYRGFAFGGPGSNE